MRVTRVRHAWVENDDFEIDRPAGTSDHVLLHFWGPVELLYEGRRVLTQADACILYPPGHRQWFRAYGGRLVHDWAHVEGDFGAAMADCGVQPGRLYYPGDGQAVTALFEDMEREYWTEERFGARIVQMRLTEFLILLQRGREPASQRAAIDPGRAQALKALRSEVFAHPDHPWQMAELAERVHLSPSHFHAVYKRLFGLSPKNDLILARIDKAKRLLAQGGFTNAQIAESVGFGSEFHFIRQFHRHTGSSPKQYKE